jgi:predicted Zn-dependent protease
MRNSVSGIIDTMMKNGYSRDQEFEADKRAIELLARAGYDPRGLTDILRVLQQVQSGQRGGFNSTHPSPQDRLNRVQSQIQTRNYERLDTSQRVKRFKNR